MKATTQERKKGLKKEKRKKEKRRGTDKSVCLGQKQKRKITRGKRNIGKKKRGKKQEKERQKACVLHARV